LNRALDRLAAEPERAWTLASLAAACGVAPRTLQKHFRRFLDCTPLEFIRDLRLDRARQQLLREPTTASVTDVATRWGFNHLGRFAAWYRMRYGESPSATLRRCEAEVGGRKPSLPILSSAVERPTIAVLPFAGIGVQASEVVGLSEEIAAAIWRRRWINVTAPRNARYHLRGKVRSNDGGRLQAIVILIDASSGRYIWADNWAGDCRDALAFEERVATGVARAIEPALRDAEIDRTCRGEQADLSAWELTMQALPRVLSLEAAAGSVALELLEQAMELAPRDPLPRSLAAWCHGLRAGHHFTRRREQEQEAARNLAAQAARLNVGDPLAETILASGYTLAHDLSAAEIHVERALTLDGGSAWAWGRRGWIKAYRGEAAEAIECFQIACALAPVDRLHFLCCHGMASAKFDAGRYAESIGWFERALAENPAAVWINRFLAPAYVIAGRTDEAQRSVAEFLKASPGVTITDVRLGLPWHAGCLDRVAEGLESAGMRP
jgi:AraC-like DNA-binding protein/tetratricopeptide (TPR) repeat protein